MSQLEVVEFSDFHRILSNVIKIVWPPVMSVDLNPLFDVGGIVVVYAEGQAPKDETIGQKLY